jgi:peptidyl-prolyl cis-trans isomerase SurA
MRKATLLILAAGLVLAGCEDKPKFTPEEMAKLPLAKRDGLPEPSGGFTLAVGDQTITAEEVVGPVFEKLAQAAQNGDFEKFRSVAGPVIERELMERIVNALLYSRAKRDAGDKIDDELDKVTAAEVRRFVMDFGGDYAKAEQSLRQMGMDWGKFEQYKKRYILSQSYLAQKLPKDQPITYSEMMSAYNAAKEQLYGTPGVLQFRLIDLEPARMRDIDANRPRQEQARELIDGIMKRIKQGEDFEQLAKEYSKANKALTGGLWQKLAPDSLVSPYNVLAQKAATMRPGETTGPVEVEGHIFVMQLVEYQSKSVEPFEKVQNQIKARISFERMRQAIDKLNEELVEQASAADRERFVDFCVREIYRDANK